MSLRSVAVLLACWATAAAAELGPHLAPALGKPAPAGFEAVVTPDGVGLPAGQGSVAEGEGVYVARCAACHGADGRLAGNALAGGRGTLATAQPLKTVGSFWPYATTLFDYVNRAMPYGNEKSLTANEVYAVTAYVLFLNEIIPADAVLSQTSLAQVIMPNRDGFRPAPDFQPVQPPSGP